MAPAGRRRLPPKGPEARRQRVLLLDRLVLACVLVSGSVHLVLARADMPQPQLLLTKVFLAASVAQLVLSFASQRAYWPLRTLNVLAMRLVSWLMTLSVPLMFFSHATAGAGEVAQDQQGRSLLLLLEAKLLMLVLLDASWVLFLAGEEAGWRLVLNAATQVLALAVVMTQNSTVCHALHQHRPDAMRALLAVFWLLSPLIRAWIPSTLTSTPGWLQVGEAASD